MDAAIDAYVVASGCHRNKGMPLDRSVACPGHGSEAEALVAALEAAP
jgi:hypothetical protein